MQQLSRELWINVVMMVLGTMKIKVLKIRFSVQQCARQLNYDMETTYNVPFTCIATFTFPVAAWATYYAESSRYYIYGARCSTLKSSILF